MAQRRLAHVVLRSYKAAGAPPIPHASCSGHDAYTEIFSRRGGEYRAAMLDFPQARAQEFQQLVNRAALRPGMTIGDVPAGGGELRRYLPDGVSWLGHEPCSALSGEQPAVARLWPLPWADASVDVIASLAGVHHLADKRPLFRDWARVVKPGGRLVLSDVGSGSAPARFLDEFVGKFNSTGHHGFYLDASTCDELQAAGWQVQSCEPTRFHWVFADTDAMVSFCLRLFDVRHATPAQMLRAIEHHLGVDRLHDGYIGMRWSLLTLVALIPVQ